MFGATLVITVLSFTSALAAPTADSWYHPRDSPYNALFKRDAPSPDDPNFASNYPSSSSSPTNLPKAWTDKLATIQLPSFGPSQPNNGYPTYTGGESGADQTICSFTYQCTTSDDLVNPPDGVIAVSFDDGPTSSSPDLYSFLQKNNIAQHATHFMIGGNILYDPKTMQAAAAQGGHIAIHTWTHPYMTTLTNEQVMGELGWTAQIIHDLNGGRVPKYWRPPFGDVDNRVRAIAKGVFGLETVPWNQDSADWAIGHDPQYTLPSVEAQMKQWLTGSKSPGLLILEHELNNNTVGNFMDSYPLMTQNGWDIKNVAEAFGMTMYLNADDNNGTVASMNVGGSASSMAPTSSSSSAPSTSTAASTTSSGSASSASSGAASSSGSAGVRAASPSASQSGSAGRSAALGMPKEIGMGGLTIVLSVVVGAMI